MSPEYYNSRNQEAYQVELISHKNSSKGRSEKQRMRLEGKKKGGGDLVYCLTSLLSPADLRCLPLHFQKGWSVQFKCSCLTQPVQLQTLQMTSQQSISKGQGKQTFTLLSVQHAEWHQHRLHLICNAVSKAHSLGARKASPQRESSSAWSPGERTPSSPVTQKWLITE